MKAIFLSISAITAILAGLLALSGLYLVFWGDLAFIQIALALIGVGSVSGLLCVAALLAAILSKMAGKI